MSWNTITTERLLIRSFTMDDLDDVHRELYSTPDVWGPRTREQTVDDLTAAVLRKKSEWAKRAVVIKESDTFIGQVGLAAYHNYFYRWEEEPQPPFNFVEVELMFAFGKQFWGRSYAFEASQAMIRYAFEELRLPRLVGGANGNNPRSINLHRRLGYRLFDALPVAGQEGHGSGIVAVLDNHEVRPRC